MAVASWSVGLFCAGFIVHWIVWHVRLPRRQTRALVILFPAVLVAGITLYIEQNVRSSADIARYSLHCLHISIFYVAMMLAYVVTYTGIEARSPSMTLLTYVADSKSIGRTRKEIDFFLLQFKPVQTRLAAMLQDGLIVEENGVYSLTRKGSRWAGTFSSWRKLIGLGKGG